MRNAGLDEAQAGIKVAGKNINTSDADTTTLMAESKEELKYGFPFLFQIWLFKNFSIIFNPTFPWIWSRKDVHIS